MTLVYNPAAYNNLPMLGDAGARFDTQKGEDLIDEFRELFQSHGLERTFGLVLNHRHFDMKSNERLVEYSGTSVPWERMLEKTQPSTWFVSEKEEVFPYEFHYSADGDDTDEKEGAETPADSKYSGFVKAFTDLLRKKDALGLFGLGRYPGDDFEGRVEITEGRANINLRPQDAPKHLASRAAAWYFSPNLLGKCVCVCGGNGHTDATHQGHVATRK